MGPNQLLPAVCARSAGPAHARPNSLRSIDNRPRPTHLLHLRLDIKDLRLDVLDVHGALTAMPVWPGSVNHGPGRSSIDRSVESSARAKSAGLAAPIEIDLGGGAPLVTPVDRPLLGMWIVSCQGFSMCLGRPVVALGLGSSDGGLVDAAAHSSNGRPRRVFSVDRPPGGRRAAV